MNRTRKVDDLYDSVKSITDRDAFQYTLDHEKEDYVLADLRERFWDGSGKQPWQVTEINRLLTRRKELRLAPAQSVVPQGVPEAPRSLRAKIEDNAVVFFLGTVVTAFCAGLAAYEGTLKLTDHVVVSSESVQKLKTDLDTKTRELDGVRKTLQQQEMRSQAEPIAHLARSEPGNHPAAHVSFVNSSGREIEIVWIDEGGSEQSLDRLADGNSYTLATFATHLLLLKDSASGEQLLLLSPRGGKPRPITVEVKRSS